MSITEDFSRDCFNHPAVIHEKRPTQSYSSIHEDFEVSFSNAYLNPVVQEDFSTWGELSIINIGHESSDTALGFADVVVCLHNKTSNKSSSLLALHSISSQISPQKIPTPFLPLPFSQSYVPLTHFEVDVIEDTLANSLFANKLKKRASKKILNLNTLPSFAKFSPFPIMSPFQSQETSKLLTMTALSSHYPLSVMPPTLNHLLQTTLSWLLIKGFFNALVVMTLKRVP